MSGFFFSFLFQHNPCFFAGKATGIWNCHATHVHRKTTVFTSIVYVRQTPRKKEEKKEKKIMYTDFNLVWLRFLQLTGISVLQAKLKNLQV
jgi:hypothetical protein